MLLSRTPSDALDAIDLRSDSDTASCLQGQQPKGINVTAQLGHLNGATSKSQHACESQYGQILPLPFGER